MTVRTEKYMTSLAAKRPNDKKTMNNSNHPRNERAAGFQSVISKAALTNTIIRAIARNPPDIHISILPRASVRRAASFIEMNFK